MTAPAAQLACCSALWDADPTTIAYVRTGANSVYTIRPRGRRGFLRLTPHRHRSRAQVEAELDFVQFASSRGLHVACPVPLRRPYDPPPAERYSLGGQDLDC